MKDPCSLSIRETLPPVKGGVMYDFLQGRLISICRGRDSAILALYSARSRILDANELSI